MTIISVLLLLAFIFFILAAFNIPAGVNLGWLGLAMWVLTLLIGSR